MKLQLSNIKCPHYINVEKYPYEHSWYFDSIVKRQILVVECRILFILWKGSNRKKLMRKKYCNVIDINEMHPSTNLCARPTRMAI